MLKYFAAGFTAALLLFGALGPAAAEKRVALVIGNSAYQHTAALKNPSNDAIDMAATLRQLGFDVIDGNDLTKEEMEQRIRAFAAKLAGADVGLFFYAGHGLQVDGKNFLAPVDAKLQSDTDLDFEAVELNLVLKQLERTAGSRWCSSTLAATIRLPAPSPRQAARSRSDAALRESTGQSA